MKHFSFICSLQLKLHLKTKRHQEMLVIAELFSLIKIGRHEDHSTGRTRVTFNGNCIVACVT